MLFLIWLLLKLRRNAQISDAVNSNREPSYCYATCTCTAMVCTGRADSLVHGRVRVGEGEWAIYYSFLIYDI
jgi:hypothetical protein